MTDQKVGDLAYIKKHSLLGVFALLFRTFFLQLIALVATFLLTVFLSPSEYGVYFIVSAVVNLLVYFSDIGLAAALIQKPQKPTDKDYQTTFTIQQFLVFSLVALALLFSSHIARWYQLDAPSLWLFRALVFSLVFSSLKTIPSIILERALKFDKLIVPQILENLSFYLVAVFGAWRGWGVTSFTVAVLVRGLVGVVTLYLLAPWRPSFHLDRRSAKQLLSFGVPFQLNSLLALVKDDLLTAFLGRILPLNEVGFLGWAQKWAFFPLRFFMDAINKVTFPAYSRLQNQPQALAKAVEKSLYAVAVSVLPTLTGLTLVAPHLIRLFPRYQKWQPALLPLTFFCLNALIASLSTSLTNLLSGIGQIKVNLKLMVFWTVLTWLTTPWLVFKIGYSGAALASVVVASTSWLTLLMAKRYVRFRFWRQVLPALFSTAVMALFFWELQSLVTSLPRLILLIVASAIIYFATLVLLDGRRLRAEVALVVNTFLNKNA